VQDDQTEAPSSVGQAGDRQFELPRVREVRRDSCQMPVDPETADAARSPSAGTEAAGAKPQPVTSEPLLPDELGGAFQRRWEQVQILFVDQAARSGRVRKRIGHQPQVAANNLDRTTTDKQTDRLVHHSGPSGESRSRIGAAGNTERESQCSSAFSSS
jgi:hypothetical protein